MILLDIIIHQENMTLKQTVQAKFDSDEVVPTTEPDKVKFVDAPTQVTKRAYSRVQFDTAPPEVIPQSLNNGKNRNRSDSQKSQDLSVADKFSQRSRLFKLVLTLALPTIVVFAQCGTMISAVVERRRLQESTNQCLLYTNQLLDLVNYLQEERHSVTSGSGYRLVNRTNHTNGMDFAMINLLADFIAKEGGNNSPGQWQNLSSELKTRRNSTIMINGSSSLDFYADLLWYTQQISSLLASIPNQVRLTSDNNGGMWKDLITLELILHVIDNLKLHQDITIGYQNNKISQTSEKFQLLTEKNFDIFIMFKLTAKFANLSGGPESNNLSNHIQFFGQLPVPEPSNNSSNNTKIFSEAKMEKITSKKATEITDSTLEIMITFVDDCLARIRQAAEEESAVINKESALAYGLLVAMTIVCPILGTVYVRSFSTMAAVISAYAGNMLVKSAELTFEKKRTDHLLFQMLPPSVASALTNGQRVPAESFDSVSVYFSDIVDFEQLTSLYGPLGVVDFLNELYIMFDTEIEHFDVYKVETIGDAYMVASGLPMRNENRHAGEVGTLALSLMRLAAEFVLPGLTDRKLLLRIGIHSGPCVACVIGLKMPRYCLFGDTVNTASRMESHGAALRIHISSSTKVILDELRCYTCVDRGSIEVKGKGMMHTWWLVGKEGMDFCIKINEMIPLATDDKLPEF